MKITDEMVNAADSVLSRVRPGIPDETIRLAIAAALSASPAGVVKPLEWEPVIDDGWDRVAKTPFGEYVISVDHDAAGGVHYLWFAGQPEEDEHHSVHKTMTAAKSAAFADYSARIMSAIEPDGVKTDQQRDVEDIHKLAEMVGATFKPHEPAGVGVETKTERVMSDPCVQKLEEGEPFFVLLGRDADASQALSTWITLRLRSEGRTDKVKAAEKTLDAFRDCQDRRAALKGDEQ